MQKLVFINANGVELDLTSGNYGITEWEGFSNASLNIQTQQVPFQDGGVFLDALIEQRELSVTLAMQDNNNLELRYQLRRELISALNPKLGEGYLIYTNDYISKRIKCVPQIPLFETHNSDTVGTPKASLSWTACEPYWEDLEDTEIVVNKNNIAETENNGDVASTVNIEIIGQNYSNVEIANLANGNKVKINGTYNDIISFSSNVGEKKVNEEALKFDWENGGNFKLNISTEKETVLIGGRGTIKINNYQIISYSINNLSGINHFYGITFAFNRYYIVADNKIYKSTDCIIWESVYTSSVGLVDICYTQEKGIFVITINGNIVSSADGEAWQETITQTNTAYSSICYSGQLSLFIGAGEDGYIIKSSDGVNWTESKTIIGNASIHKIRWAKDRFIVVGYDGYLRTSSDGDTWQDFYSVTDKTLIDVCYCEEYGLYLIVGASGRMLRSKDAENWTVQTVKLTETYISILYSHQMKYLISLISQGCFIISKDGVLWCDYLLNIGDITSSLYLENQKKYYIVSDNGNIAKGNEEGWEVYQVSANHLKKIIYSQEKNIFIVVGYQNNNFARIVSSRDGVNWQVVFEPTLTTSRLYSVCYSAKLGIFIGVGQKGIVCKSQDGISWDYYRLADANVNLNDIIYDSGKEKFIAVGKSANAVIYTSEDGVNWNIETLNTSSELKSISQNQETIIAVGNGIIASTKNLEEWVVSSSDIQFRYIKYMKEFGLWIGLGGNNVYISADGEENWNLNEGIKSFLNSVSNSFSEILLFGNYSEIYKSETVVKNNIINELSQDSDISFKIETGKNKFRFSYSGDSAVARIIYRQKYIGV